MMIQQDIVAAQVYDEPAGLDPWQYFDILRKRAWYLVLPFFLVLFAGGVAAWVWPPVYMSEGKILVESQQIPTDLVKPTVTASAKERLEIIQQRVMTRNNLLAILDKYNLYPDQRARLSRSEQLDLMRQNIVITPVDVQRRGQSDTIAMTVGFMDRQADTATRVANDLITLFLNEDARTRTSRASETTRFLAREVERLKGDLAGIDQKIAEANLTMARSKFEQRGPTTDSTLPQLAALRGQLVEKSAVFSPNHPEIRRLKAQIKALENSSRGSVDHPESTVTPAAPAPASGAPPVAAVTTELLDALQKQRDFVQKSFDEASQKYAAAQLGEKLERDQYSERLEVLEQAVPPQKPIKPNRGKIIGFSVIAAFMAGFAGVFAIETMDRTLRGSRDLVGIADSGMVLSIPYIATKSELVRKRQRLVLVAAFLVAILIAALAAIHFLVRPLDELWPILIERISTNLSTLGKH